MQLQPRRQPGRADRKAAAYALEIVRLRSEGYTFEAIREALADVGIALSTSALRREVRRHRTRPGVARPSPTPVPPAHREPGTRTPHPASPRPEPSPSAPPVLRGREIAAAFFATHGSHPLLRTEDSP